MASLSVSALLPAEVSRVWEDVARLESHVEWMADAESIHFDGPQRQGLGVTMRVSTRLGPLRTVDVIRVVNWEPPVLIGVVHEGLVTGTGEFRLSPQGGGTRFTWDEELVFPWYFGGVLAAWAARPLLRWVWRRNLARLAERFR